MEHKDYTKSPKSGEQKVQQRSITLDKMREIRQVSDRFAYRQTDDQLFTSKVEKENYFEGSSENSEIQAEGGEAENAGVHEQENEKEASWQGGVYIWNDDKYGGDEEEVENTHWVAANFKREKKEDVQPDEEQKKNHKNKIDKV